MKCPRCAATLPEGAGFCGLLRVIFWADFEVNASVDLEEN